jgi:hypothetical protein
VSKEEIFEAIKKLAEELGRAPSIPELRDRTGISPRQVRRKFLTYTAALKACGLEKGGAGYTTPMDALFTDWAELTRKLGRAPKMGEYDMYAKYSAKPLLTRFGTWGEVPAGPAVCGGRKGLGRRLGGCAGGCTRPLAGRGEGGKEVEDGQRDTYSGQNHERPANLWASADESTAGARANERTGCAVSVWSNRGGHGICGDARPDRLSRLRSDARGGAQRVAACGY